MEPLNHILCKELCAEVMKQYKNRPKKLHAFVLSGQEPLAAFLDLCRSIKSLTISDATFTAHFSDPDVDDVFTCIGRWRGSKKTITKMLFHHAKTLKLEFNYVPHSKNQCVRHLHGLKSVENVEIKFEDASILNPRFVRTVMQCIGPIKQLKSDLEAWQVISSVVQELKLDKMTVYLSFVERMLDVMVLKNVFPVELEIIGTALADLEEFFKHFNSRNTKRSFVGVKKLKLQLNYEYSGILNRQKKTFFHVLRSIQNRFPNLEELVFDHGFINCCNIYVEPADGGYPAVDAVQKHVNAIHKELTKFECKFKLRVIFRMFYRVCSHDCMIDPCVADLNKGLRGYSYSYSAVDSEHCWKKDSIPRADVSFDVVLSIRKRADYTDSSVDSDQDYVYNDYVSGPHAEFFQQILQEYAMVPYGHLGYDLYDADF